MRTWFTDTATKSKPVKAAAAPSSPIKKLLQSFMLAPRGDVHSFRIFSPNARTMGLLPGTEPAIFFCGDPLEKCIGVNDVGEILAGSPLKGRPSTRIGPSPLVERGQQQVVRIRTTRHVKNILCH